MVKTKIVEKEIYVAPVTKVIMIEPEGVLCGSTSQDPTNSFITEGDRWGGSWGDDF